MKIRELMENLYARSGAHLETTCDTCKSGDPEKELHKVAVTMFDTPAVIRDAARWGAELLIVHEPTFYDHMDQWNPNNTVAAMKYELLKQSGLTVYRFHDHAHRMNPDLIFAGEQTYLGLTGQAQRRSPAITRLTLDEPITARTLALRMQKELGIAQPRVCGTLDQPVRRLSCCFGTPGGVFEELQNPEIDMVLTGEACEWKLAEYARDADQLGLTKTLIIMGHIGSERDGMRLLADKLPMDFPELEVRYFECGEVYTYPESHQE